MIRNIALVCSIFYCFCISAQNVKEDMRKARSFFTKDKYSMQMEYLIFFDKRDNPLRNSVTVMKDHEKVLSITKDIEVLTIGNKTILTSIPSKIISITKKPPQKTTPVDFLALLDSSLKQLDSVSFRVEKNNLLHYTFHSIKGNIKQTEIYLDQNNYQIKKIEYQSNNSTDGYYMVVINFLSINITPKFKKDELSECRYFMKKNNTYVGVNKFKGFKILDGSQYYNN